MSKQRALLLGLTCLWLAGAAFAGSKPVTVSPGDTAKFVQTRDTCPTFSWGAVAGAVSYELVVYDVGRQGDDPEAVLSEQLPGSASSWTPPLGACLQRGGSYAWSIRTVDRRGAESQGPDSWSAARLFSIPAGPTLDEVEEALAVLREFVGSEHSPRQPSRLPRLRRNSVAPAPAGVSSGVAAPSRTAESVDPEGKAPPPSEAVGLVSDLDSATLPTWAVHGIARSDFSGSTGVFGEATATATSAYTYGVRGEVAGGLGAGVEGVAWGATGRTAGVYGFAVSPEGYAGMFESNFSGTGGVFASAASNAYSDLVLGGTSASNDDGTLRSDPRYGNSDIFIDANDAVVVRLNHDNAGSDTDNDFWVENGAGTRLLNVDESGDVTVDFKLIVDGSVGGVLVDQGDIDASVAAALLEHENAYHPLHIFVTSTTYQGNLGGLGGGDAKCQARASAAGLQGTFKAWISGNNSGLSAGTRLTFHSRPYYLPSGHKVADSGGDLKDGTLDHAIDHDEFGALVTTSTTAYTNTYANGNYVDATRDCGPSATEWTSSSNLESGGYGLITSTTSSWSWTTNNHCANYRRLYCVQQ